MLYVLFTGLLHDYVRLKDNAASVVFLFPDFGPSAAKSKGRKREMPSPVEGPRKRKK